MYLPSLQPVFHIAPLSLTDVAVLASFPVTVWGTDELRHPRMRRYAHVDRDRAT